MRLKDEIAALRAEFEAHVRPGRAEERSPISSTAANEQVGSPHNVEALLDMMDATLEEFSEELERFPKLTAIAALGVGLAIGLVIGRQLR